MRKSLASALVSFICMCAGAQTLFPSPLVWSLESLTVKAADSQDFSLYNLNDFAHISNFTAEHASIYGTSRPRWDVPEKARAKWLAEREPSDCELHISLLVRNNDSARWRIENLQFPIRVNGREIAGAISEKSAAISIPANSAKLFRVRCVATIPAASYRAFFRAFSLAVPSFDFDDARGIIRDDDTSLELRDICQKIRASSVAVTIDADDGRAVTWRVAKGTSAAQFANSISPALVLSAGNSVLSALGLDAIDWAADSVPLFPKTLKRDFSITLRGVVQNSAALTARAEAGDHAAQYELAQSLLAAEKSAEGIVWLSLAANAGEKSATLSYAQALLNGEFGLRADPKRATALLATAADSNPAAAALLASCYRNGIGVAADISRAHELYALAAENGDAEAAVWLAFDKLNGVGGNFDPRGAQNLLASAAKAGNVWGKYLFGITNFAAEKLGLVADYRLAAENFAAVAKEIPAAYAFLGFCYYEGKGVTKDTAKAFAAFKAASDAGLFAARLWTAHCLATGEGTAKNPEEAKKLLTSPPVLGSAQAAEMLKSLGL